MNVTRTIRYRDSAAAARTLAGSSTALADAQVGLGG